MSLCPRVVAFDVNETLTDLSPLGERFEFVGAPRSTLEAWFASTLRDGIALTAAGAYADFADVARATLRTALADVPTLRGELDDAVDAVLAGLPALDLHPDVPAGMRRLHEAGIRLVTLTNGAAELARPAFERAGVLELLERTLSVSEPRRWKPAPEPYRWAAQLCDVAPAEMGLVAVHPWDVDGAQRAGLVGAWLDRKGVRYPEIFGPPAVVGHDMTGVADGLLGLGLA